MTVRVWEIKDRGNATVLKEDILKNRSLVTMNDVTRELPNGAYTTFRTYQHHNAINIENHLDRLEETAKLANNPISLQRETILAGIREAIKESSNLDSRVRIFVDLSLHLGSVLILLEPLQTPPAECYKKGIEVVTCEIVRDNPQAKLTNFISIAHEIRQNLNSKFEEALLVDRKGFILEGLTSNFFSVVDNRLQTAGCDILLGVTRSIVLNEAAKMGMDIRYEPVSIHDIATITEAFITSSSRGILPIRTIDGTRIGTGKPGPCTRLLTKHFEQTISKLQKPI